MERMNTTGRKVIRYALDRLVGHIWIVRADRRALMLGYSRRDKDVYPIVSGTAWNKPGDQQPIEMSRNDLAREILKCRRRGYSCVKCSPA